MSNISPATAAATLTAHLAEDLAGYCLRVAGPGRTCLFGQELAAMVAPLRAAGCEVVVEEGTDEGVRMDVATLGIAWAGSGAERSAALGRQVDTLVLIGDEGCAAELAAWTLQAAALGWQVHPAAFAMTGAPDGVVMLALSRAGVAVSGGSVAPQASYQGLAAALVRPGDAVIATDAAEHGLWRIVQQQSRCRWLGVLTRSPTALPQEPAMEWLASSEWPPHAQPVDTLITQLPDDLHGLEPWLQHAQAALVRSGRMVVAIPLHDGRTVSTAALVAAMEQQGLVIDRAWWQTFSRPAGLRQFAEVARAATGYLALEPEAGSTADALILMAVKVAGPGVVADPSLLAPNIVAFQRDYLDASLVRLIVAMGLRLESAGLRRQLARKVLLDCAESSADYGAALCVLLYDADEMRNQRRSELLAAAMRYMDAPAANPTVLRWQVSLAFAAATLHQADGELSLAAECYSRVLGFDVLQFSPLLGTKTTAAAVRLGWIRFGQGNLAAARSAWARGLDEVRRLSAQSAWKEVVGDADAPETFALPEFAAVMDEAGCLASALRLTAEVPLRPGVAWQWSNRSWRAQLQELRGQLQHDQLWQGQLQEAKDWLDDQYHLLTAELERCRQGRDALASQKHALDSELVGVRAAFHLSHQHAMAEYQALQQQLRDAQAENAVLMDIQARQQVVHAQLEASARMLAEATGMVMGNTPQRRLPAESLAEEMSRLADALERLPLKRMVRTMLRALTTLLGRR